jgi:hypothetical protein
VCRPPFVDRVHDAIDQRRWKVGAGNAQQVAVQDRIEEPLDRDEIESERARVLERKLQASERCAQ